MLECGFDTIGNATLICYDRGPVLCTDPWVCGTAYFGSWALSHEIPAEQRNAIRHCQFVWFSHAHPDHLNAESLPFFREKEILLPDHVGGRIARDLTKLGYRVHSLPDRTWVQLSHHVRVLCIADYNQDAVLLVDLGGRHLLVNVNDAADLGWASFVRKIAKSYPQSFLLAYAGWGDADMMNFYTEDGSPIVSAVAQKPPIGKMIRKRMLEFGANAFVPFSSMHRYQRADSCWANQFIPHLNEYQQGFEPKTMRLLPAYIRYNCAEDSFMELCPRAASENIFSPEVFGDDWSTPLDKSDLAVVENYFRAIAHLSDTLDFVNCRVGGKDHVVELNTRFNRGITFEAPRFSFITALAHEVFDDMLIANFMKTTLHGKWPTTGLYPDFSPFVGKYADNGRAKSRKELESYFELYRKRAPVEYIKHRVAKKCEEMFRAWTPSESPAYRIGRSAYWFVKSIGASVGKTVK